MKRKLEVMREIDAANKKHLEDWKAAQPKNFYFTFGTDPRYPFGYNDYVLILCKDARTACKLFDAVHPPRTEGIMNCAFMYGEEQWEKGVKEHYQGREPIEVISVTGSR